MKKILSICILMCIIITGCYNKEEIVVREDNISSVTICRGEQTINDNATATLRYEISASGDVVNKLSSIETITSDDIEYLNQTKESIEKTYSIYKDIEYYKYKIELNDNILTSTVNIDYTKINMDKLISIDKANENIISNGKVSLNYLKNMYESLGNVCINKN